MPISPRRIGIRLGPKKLQRMPLSYVLEQRFSSTENDGEDNQPKLVDQALVHQTANQRGAGEPLDTWYAGAGGPIALWQAWSDDVQGHRLSAGHFFPEEDPEHTADLLSRFFTTGSHG